MTRYDYHRPGSLQEAWELKNRIPEARFVAGGTDLLVKIKNRVVTPPALLSLRGIRELSGIRETGGALEIGATTTIAEILESPVLQEHVPVLVQAASRLGSVQIRNAATVGGNLCNCSPCADTATPLLVLGARARLQGPAGTREIPLAEFFVGPGQTCSPPGEILTAVILDKPAAGTRTTFRKKGRVRMDLAIASVCTLLEIRDGICRRARIAAGSCAPVPLRLEPVERLLEGETITPDLATRAGELAAASVSPISDIRASEAYRRRIIGVYLSRSIRELAGWSGS